MGASVTLFYMKPSSPLPSIPLSSHLFSFCLNILFYVLSLLLFLKSILFYFFSRDFQLISSFLCNFFNFSHIFSCCLISSHFCLLLISLLPLLFHNYMVSSHFVSSVIFSSSFYLFSSYLTKLLIFLICSSFIYYNCIYSLVLFSSILIPSLI